ncbi:hypothetical protein ASPZODRAFT_136317 [Penicilliopsis zonata CBS 506.65]|uniref:Uncharacterized protein n=1 Tax=Penicilliopsis zonata CBS 506.65 TaxID=1073090 RepID=A0A1L9S8G6_9EURO|nr:hypothetical protein ASPZODRAFT_136317 [Penicilliopsis zonata CBS 506.65]OJJ43452.1 hypothetical protein ASPZODRAFT_136317 [Penicilliopsis zonata CBS 506.65]
MQLPTPNPTIFFISDFVRSTHRTLHQVDASAFAMGDQNARAAVKEVIGRNSFTDILVNDTTGKLALMTGQDPRNPVDFGPDIKRLAKALSS